MGRRKGRMGVAVEAGTEIGERFPSWFSEAVLFGKYWLDSGLVGYLEEDVRVVRGWMVRYEVMDYPDCQILHLICDRLAARLEI